MMRNVTGLLLLLASALAALLLGKAGATQPLSGHCAGNRCYAVFKEHGDFDTARDECTQQAGQLMTVRTAEAHDSLSVLLENLAGSFWIGLSLPSGCPVPSAELKGFQWVTKDTDSDFVNWAPGFDDSCASARCVSISPEDDFKWTPTPCDAHVAGFLCEYVFTEPCDGLPVAEGERVTYRVPMGFETERASSLPGGTIADQMPAEAKYVCVSHQWLQAPWTCEIKEGGCEHKCAVTPNSHQPVCYCPPGHIVNPANKVTCEVTPEDPCARLRCQQACYEKPGDPGSYACVCDHGFKLASDGRSCRDFNDCKDERQCPGDNVRCVNTVGGFECLCKEGFKKNAEGQCVDVDECASAPCEHNCINTHGSYSCSCFEGYKKDPKSPDKCKLHCGKEECPAKCDPNDMFQCYCPDGYLSEERGDQTVCIDIDECSFFYCDQACENNFGGYACSCSPGYTLVGQYKCIKDEDDGDPDGSGWTPDTPTPAGTPSPFPFPGPTRRPAALTPGGLAGVIICTASFIVLLVFLAHYFLCVRETKKEPKSPEAEVHGLNYVANDP